MTSSPLKDIADLLLSYFFGIGVALFFALVTHACAASGSVFFDGRSPVVAFGVVGSLFVFTKLCFTKMGGIPNSMALYPPVFVWLVFYLLVPCFGTAFTFYAKPFFA